MTWDYVVDNRNLCRYRKSLAWTGKDNEYYLNNQYEILTIRRLIKKIKISYEQF